MHDVKNILDWSAVGTAIGSIMKWMPEVAALFSVIWMGIRFYEWVKEKRNGHER